MSGLRTIILAAGKGTRMKSDIPKVLHAVCGQPMIQYVVEVAKVVGSLKICVVLGHKIDLVKQTLGSEFIFVHQKSQLGTADAVKVTEEYFKNYDGDVLILCGDTPLLVKDTIKEIVRRHKRTKAALTFLTAGVDNPQGYGRIIHDDKGKTVAIREDKDALDSEREIAEINVGVYCFNSKALFSGLKEIQVNKKKNEFYLTDIVELFAKKGLRVETVKTNDPQSGLGINNREDLAVAESVIRERILKSFMLSGVTIIDPKTTFIQSDVKIGNDTIIYPFTWIEANVRIGKNCHIGPFARIRSGTRISDHAQVGNFTEIARSSLGKGTLMKHFSYLGDTTIGSHVNIGAGSVTANFDGRDKHQTKISDNAFIGSGSILVAPVKIGKNAVVGAGSVVPHDKNIPDGSVAFGVPARIISREKNR